MIGKIMLYILSLVLLGVFVIILSREYSHREIDDVHPRIIENMDDPFVRKSKWLWIIPLYMDDPISNYPEWVEEVKKSGKKIGWHGVKHTHKEFEKDLTDEYIDSGIAEFKKAFGFYPTHFKAPSLALTKNNKKKIEDRGIKIKSRFNQVMHTVYHSPKHRRENGMLIGE